MEKLSSYLDRNTFIIEAFGSAMVRDMFDAMKVSNKNNYTTLRKDMLKELRWDDITDSDIETLTAEDAIKMIYKHSGNPEYMIWFDNNGVARMRSIGIVMTTGNDPSFNRNAGIKSIARNINCSKVYYIPDYEKFSTKDLRDLRRAQKSGALALKDADTLLKEHQDKLEKLMANHLGKKYLHLDMTTQFEELTARFTEYLNAAKTNGDFLAKARDWHSAFSDLMSDYEGLVNEMSRIISDQKDAEMYYDRDIDDNEFANVVLANLVKKIKEFNIKRDKFFAKYDIEAE